MNTARTSNTAGLLHTLPTAVSAELMATPQQPSSPNSARAIQWLSQQSADLMDACLSHLSSAESAELSGPWMRFADAAQSPRTLLTARLAASSHHHLMSGVVSGPLHEAISTGLDVAHEAPYDASNWLRVPEWRDALFAERNALHNELLTDAYQPHQNVPQDNTTAILALDKLDCASPLKDAQWAAMGFGREPWQQRQDRRIAGYEALLLASSFSAPMQNTLLGHVIVGTALAYLGMADAATAVVRDAVEVQLPRRLAQESTDGPDKGYGPLRGHSTAPGQQAMVWLTAAALAADAPMLHELQQQGSHALQPLQHMQVTCLERRRWQHLEQALPLHHPNVQSWCTDVGMDALTRMFSDA